MRSWHFAHKAMCLFTMPPVPHWSLCPTHQQISRPVQYPWLTWLDWCRKDPRHDQVEIVGGKSTSHGRGAEPANVFLSDEQQLGVEVLIARDRHRVCRPIAHVRQPDHLVWVPTLALEPAPLLPGDGDRIRTEMPGHFWAVAPAHPQDRACT
jgi:hypothetical protein